MKHAIAVTSVLAAIANCVLAGEPVLSVTGGTGGFPGADTSHGWEFVVNEAIIVTHLGLYDSASDGIQDDHSVGLFRLSDSALLTSGTISAGQGDLLLDGFRYIDTPDVTLNVDETYVISFYSAVISSDLDLSLSVFGLSVDPVITLKVPARWEASTGDLALPSNYSDVGFDPYRIGPNFQFIVVPEPTAFSLIGFGSLLLVMTQKQRRPK